MEALAGVPGSASLDLQTGGGEVVAKAAAGPETIVVTESWPPNVEVARRNLATLGARVVAMDDEFDPLPFPDASFDLVSSRHPVGIRFDEVARVLKPGGTYLSQDVGHRSVVELTEAMMGPSAAEPEPGPNRDPKWTVRDATAAGLEIVDLQEFRGRMEFFDIAAVVHFLRKVIWIVPGFEVEAYRERLRALPMPFSATTVRFLVEARKQG
jgi:SAM-dependent methyltransferase